MLVAQYDANQSIIQLDNENTIMKKWLKVLLAALVALALLLVAAVGWFVADVTSNLDTPEKAAAATGILAYAEPSPARVRRTPENPDASALDFQSLAHPSPIARPWTRWWWPGGDVTAESACDQLAELREHGFGGVEVQAFNAGLRAIKDEATQARINSFGSEQWFATMDRFMDCAARLGVAVYLNHLSGWPAGGPQVGLEDGLWTLRFGETVVDGGKELRIDLPVPTPGVNDYLMALAEYFIGMELSSFAVDQRQLVGVQAARITGGQRRASPLDATDTLELDPLSVQQLTDRVVDGELHWQAPEGKWVVVASYLMPSGEAPTLVAAEDPGYVIDHLDAERVRAHYDFAYGRRTGLDKHYGDAFSGFFNDSLEFKLDRLAARDVLNAFAARRGYDLTPHLPAIFVDAYDNFFIRDVGRTRSAPAFSFGEHDDRIRHDYQLTLSDLVIERFAEASAAWAQDRGLLSRGQTYGFEMDTIRAMGANHIPETEHLWGNSSEYVMKLASAAGLLYGRPLVSAESFVWLKRAYAVTTRHIKAGADLLFLSGVNQVIYHGVSYVSDEEPYLDTFGWLGWYPFQGPENPSGFSDNYGPATPTWDVLPELNGYMARAQNILQAGKPSVDVLVYYPFLGFPKDIEDSEVAGDALLFAGLLPGDPPVQGEGVGAIPFDEFLPPEKDPRLEWLERLIPTLRTLDARGLTWNWVNGHALQTGRVDAGEFKALLVADVEAMPPKTVDALAVLADSPMALFFLGALPVRQPGFHDYIGGDARVAGGVRALAEGRRVADASQLVEKLTPRLALDGDTSIRRVSRQGRGGALAHFLVNRSIGRAEGVLTPSADGASADAYWFDADSGALWPAVPSPGGGYALSLGPLESRFLLFPGQPLDGYSRPLSVLREDAVSTFELSGDWKVSAGKMEQVIQPPFELAKELPYEGGEAVELVYTHRFEMAAGDASRRVLLHLGSVSGIARLEVNGVRYSPRSFDPFLFDVTGSVRPGENRLHLRIEPPLRNSLVNSRGLMDEEFEQFRNQVGEVGLGGPVTVSLLDTAEKGDR